MYVCVLFFVFFAAPSALKKIPLSSVIKDRLSRFFCIVDCSRANLISAENLMASGIIPLRDILSRARAAASIGAKRTEGASASAQPVSQQPETRSRKKRHLIQVEDDPSAEEEVEERHRHPAPVPPLGGSTKSPGGGKSVKTRSGQPDLRSLLSDGESALVFIGTTC